MITKIQKWGNSLAVRLPKKVVERLSLRQNQEVAVQNERTRIIVTPVEPEIPALERLVNEITTDNKHPSINWGTRVGREI